MDSGMNPPQRTPWGNVADFHSAAFGSGSQKNWAGVGRPARETTSKRRLFPGYGGSGRLHARAPLSQLVGNRLDLRARALACLCVGRDLLRDTHSFILEEFA